MKVFGHNFVGWLDTLIMIIIDTNLFDIVMVKLGLIGTLSDLLST